MNNDLVDSTLDKTGKAFLQETINVDTLVNDYQFQFGFNVGVYFRGIKEIKIYECINTKYRFYYPLGIYGDSSFYENLQTFDWYYMPWKWEHATTMDRLVSNDKVLEVGSGGLGFVEKMNANHFNITGLELNNQSVLKSKKLGLQVFNQTIEDHAINHFEEYDVVCSFQVLEHIGEVHSFIKAQVDCLKKGGKLIISVPNNDSFLKYTKGLLLNMPPHHMGLWNKKSLSSLTNLFDIKLDSIIYEPLQEYHLDWYVNSTIAEIVNKSNLFRIVFRKMRIRKVYSYLIKKCRKFIHGHTVLAVYTKV
jgi:2-polyprenyl-3-methyl-5-hydroxy-6-metoxy-1,4-benzoquinol methylase